MRKTGLRLSDKLATEGSSIKPENDDPKMNLSNLINSLAKPLDNNTKGSSKNSAKRKDRKDEVIDSWGKNLDQANSFYHDAKELSALYLQLRHLLYGKLAKRLPPAAFRRLYERTISKQLHSVPGSDEVLFMGAETPPYMWDRDHMNGRKFRGRQQPFAIQKYVRRVQNLQLIREKVALCKQFILLELGRARLPHFNSDQIMALLKKHIESQLKEHTESHLQEDTKSHLKEDTKSHLREDTKSHLKEDTESLLQEDTESDPKEHAESHSSLVETGIPDVLSHLIYQKVINGYWPIALDEIYQAARNSGMSPSKALGFIWWKYTLKSMHFFVKHNLLSQQTLGKYLYDSKISETVYLYVEQFVWRDAGKYINLGSHSLAEHWYWALEHGEFKTANKNFKDRINTFFLMGYSHIHILSLLRRNRQHGGHRAWGEFCSHLLKVAMERYRVDALKFNSIDLVHQVDNMIEIVAWEKNLFSNQEEKDLRIIMNYICDLLALVKRNHPKLFRRKLNSHPLVNEFDNRYGVLHLGAKLDAIEGKEERLHKYIRHQEPPDLPPSEKLQVRLHHPQYSEFQSISDHHKEEFKSILEQLQQERMRVFTKKNGMLHSTFCGEVNDNIRIFQKAEEKMRAESDELLPPPNSLNQSPKEME